ncbi:MAG: hypothetical protein AAGF11_35965 [Myxococcota bacterium]
MTPPLDGFPLFSQPSGNPQTSGDQLFFDFDARADLLDIVHDDGTKDDYWEKKVPFTFESNSAVVTFSPNDTSYAIDGTVTDPDGRETPLGHAGNRAFAVITKPSAIDVSFTFDIRHVAPRTTDPQADPGDPSINPLLRTQAVLTIKETPADPDVNPGDATTGG